LNIVLFCNTQFRCSRLYSCYKPPLFKNSHLY